MKQVWILNFWARQSSCIELKESATVNEQWTVQIGQSIEEREHRTVHIEPVPEQFESS